MKVRLVLDVDAYTRFVVARYFRPVDVTKTRVRATRQQMKRFALAAMRTAVREQALNLDARGRLVAQRLALSPGYRSAELFLAEPREKQRDLAF